MENLSKELKERIPKIIKYMILFVILVGLNHLLLPFFAFLDEFKISYNFSIYNFFQVLFPILSLFIIFKVSTILLPVMDLLASNIINTLPGFEKVEESGIKRILADFAYIIIVILVGVALTPAFSKIKYLSLFLNIAELVLIFFLIYDAGKTGYKIIDQRAEHLKEVKINIKKLKNKENPNKIDGSNN
ncbi:MAG: hypothetical protein QXY45_03480 [Candidatus Aenigmatarchaeota archaeon]